MGGGRSADVEPMPRLQIEVTSDAVAYFDALNEHFSNSDYLVGDYFSIADITLLCSIDFARVVKIRVDEEYTHLLDWYARVSARASASA